MLFFVGSMVVEMKIKSLIALLFTVLSLNASNAMATDFTTGEVSRIYVSGDVVNFRLAGNVCKGGNSYWQFSLTSNPETKKSWYTMLLAAANTKSDVTVGHQGCNTNVSQTVSYIYQDY